MTGKWNIYFKQVITMWDKSKMTTHTRTKALKLNATHNNNKNSLVINANIGRNAGK